LGALRSLQSKKKLSALKRQETHVVSNEEKEKWIEDSLDRETAVGRKRVQDPEIAIIQEQEHMRKVGKARSTTRKPEKTFEEMLNAIGDILSNLTTAGDEEDGEDEDVDEEDAELVMLCEDDEPGWVMGTISKIVLFRMESFRQKLMKLD